jgi:hypothetical protein
MKITRLTPVLATVLGLALASIPATVHAQTATNATAPAAPSTAPKKEKKKSEYTQFPKDAAITAIDATSVTLSSAKGPLTLAIAAETKIEVNKKKAAVTDFAVGDKVTGSYATGADGTLTAHSLRKKIAK